jgi:A/G-specific adenine glycosylase
MARVLERVFGPRKLVDIRYDPYLPALARPVVRGGRVPEVNWAILDLAAKVYTTNNPKCPMRPLRVRCRYAYPSR